MPSQAKISILIPAHNQLRYCRACIDSLRRCTPEPHRLILVDNGSTDGVSEYFDSVDGATVVHSPTNVGFAAGVNLGLAHAEGHVVLLNSDTLLTPAWLPRLIRALKTSQDDSPPVGLAGPRTNNAPGPQQIEGLSLQTKSEIYAFAEAWAQEHAGEVREVQRLVGFCLLIHQDALKTLGPLDERFGFGNFEDDDYCTRARRAGYRLLIAEDCFVYHHGGRTFAGLGLEGEAFERLLAENRRRYEEKWDAHVPAPPAASELAARARRQADQALAEGRAGAAVKLLRQAVELEPDQAAHYAALAGVLRQGGQVDLAYKLLLQALEKDRWCADALRATHQCAQELMRANELEQWLAEHRPQRMIFFLLPENSPRDLVKSMRLHLDVLRENSFDAAELPPDQLVRNALPGDIAVVTPECARDTEGLAHVAMELNLAATFARCPWDSVAPLPHASALATLVPSAGEVEYLRHALPEARVYRCSMGVPLAEPYHESEKRRQACFFRGQHEPEARQVFHLLQARGIELPFCPMIPEDTKSAREIMRASRFFLALGASQARETAEAMAMGCIAVGYAGLASEDFFQVPYAYPIEHGDVVGIAGTLEALLEEDLAGQSRIAAAFIREEFGEAAARQSILDAWHEILKLHEGRVSQ